MYCYVFHLFREVEGLVCALVESVPLLDCGLFHTAPIHDVTSFPEWVICPGSSQRNKLVGIKVPLILFPGGWQPFLERSIAAVWAASNHFLGKKSGSRPEFKCFLSDSSVRLSVQLNCFFTVIQSALCVLFDPAKKEEILICYYLRQGGHSVPFVCRFVCQQDYRKTAFWFSWKVLEGCSKNPVNAGADPTWTIVHFC